MACPEGRPSAEKGAPVDTETHADTRPPDPMAVIRGRREPEKETPRPPPAIKVLPVRARVTGEGGGGRHRVVPGKAVALTETTGVRKAATVRAVHVLVGALVRDSVQVPREAGTRPVRVITAIGGPAPPSPDMPAVPVHAAAALLASP